MTGLARAESKSKQVDKITCEEFLELNPDDQPCVAYWVDSLRCGEGRSHCRTGR